MALSKKMAKRWMPKSQDTCLDDLPDTGSTDISWVGVGVGSKGGALQGHQDGGTGGPLLPQALSSGEVAGRELLSMLKCQESVLSAKRPEPQPLSKDEYHLWMMQAREDAEGGADALNAETFGNDHDPGWSFEENLAANDFLTKRVEAEAFSLQQVAHPRRKALGLALQEMSNFIELKPRTLQKAVRSIINEGWNNITWHSRFTPFHLAAELDRPEILRLLFLVGGDPVVIDVQGETPMDVAKRCRHCRCVEILTTLGAILPHSTSSASSGRPGQAEQVPVPSFVAPGLAAQIRKADAHETSRDVERLKAAIHEAAKHFRLEPSTLQEAILHLIATGSSFLPGSQSTITTVLHLAAHLGRHEVIPLIVVLGNNLFLRDWAGRTAMDVAFFAGHHECVEALHRCQLQQ